jgi:hypothetical protein
MLKELVHCRDVHLAQSELAKTDIRLLPLQWWHRRLFDAKGRSYTTSRIECQTKSRAFDAKTHLQQFIKIMQILYHDITMMFEDRQSNE